MKTLGEQLITVVLALLFFFCAIGNADDIDDARVTRDFAHAAGGYVVNTGAYGIWKSIMLPRDKATAVVFAVLTTAIVCSSKEASDWSRPGGVFSGRNMAACGLGVGASVLSIKAFGF